MLTIAISRAKLPIFQTVFLEKGMFGNVLESHIEGPNCVTHFGLAIEFVLLHL